MQQEFLVDVFLHTYNQSVLSNPRAGELNVTLDIFEWQMLEPIRFQIDRPETADRVYDAEYYIRYGEPWKMFSDVTLRNMLRQLYSIEQCYRLIESYSKEKAKQYDFHIFSRPDVHYLPPGIPDIRPLVKGSASVATRFYDRFAAGHPQAIKVWAHRMLSATNFLEDTKPGVGLHAEKLLLYHLKKNNVSLIEIQHFCFFRVRANGATEEIRDAHDCYHVPTYTDKQYSSSLWLWLSVLLFPFVALVVLLSKPCLVCPLKTKLTPPLQRFIDS